MSTSESNPVLWEFVDPIELQAMHGGSADVIFGSGGSAVHRSTDLGSTWTRVLDRGGEVVGVGPDGTVCAARWQPGLLYRDGLVYCSMDAGANWSELDDNSNFLGADISGIALLGTDLLVATDGRVHQGDQARPKRGLFRSPDRGRTWSTTDLTTDDPLGGISSGPTSRGFFALGQGGMIFARFQSEAIAQNTVAFFRSTDQSATWTELPEPPFGEVRAMAQSPAGLTYAVGSEAFPGVGLVDGVYVSEDLGTTWRRTSLLEDDATFLDVAVTPDGRVFVAAGYSGVFVTADHGETWTKSNTDLPVSSIGTLEISVRGVFVGPDSNLYALTDLGLYRSQAPAS